MKATIEKVGELGWIYRLGPFHSKMYKRETDAKRQATKHEKRGLSPEFWKRYNGKCKTQTK